MKFFKASFIAAAIFLFTLTLYPQTSYTVQAVDFSFNPATINISKGDTVKWVWGSGTHTTTSDSANGFVHWDAPLDQNHTSFTMVFHTPGTFPYHCTFHQSIGMIGTITVESPSAVIINKNTPDKYLLDQNYPNPFNPTTKIEFQIVKSGFVSLKVFNVLGNEVATLVNGKKQSGTYDVNFDGSNYPSGIYFYRFESNGYVDVKKMVLLK